MKILKTALLAVSVVLLLVTPVLASEEVACGFVMRNIGPDPVTVTITNLTTREKETVLLQGQEQKTKEYVFTEPGTVRYLLEDNASPEKHSYTVELLVGSDDEGNLTGYTAAWITGAAVKPEELCFGTKPPAAKTGDTAHPTLYLLLCAGAVALGAAAVLSRRIRKKKKGVRAEAEKERSRCGNY